MFPGWPDVTPRVGDECVVSSSERKSKNLLNIYERSYLPVVVVVAAAAAVVEDPIVSGCGNSQSTSFCELQLAVRHL